ncbi:MAG: histone family protein [Methermicoccaceae archaeon]
MVGFLEEQRGVKVLRDKRKICSSVAKVWAGGVLLARTRIIPSAPVERLIRDAGAGNVRVSEGGREALADIIDEYGREIATEAIKLSKHAGRKTVKGEDVRLAYERVYRGHR